MRCGPDWSSAPPRSTNRSPSCASCCTIPTRPPPTSRRSSRKGYRLIAPARRLERRPSAPSPGARPPAAVSGDAVTAAVEETAVTAARPCLRASTAVETHPMGGRRRLSGSSVLALLALSWLPLRRYMARARITPSIVVLPFVDMSADKSEQPFCDGLTEELSSWLAQLPTLRVVARTSAFSFKDKPDRRARHRPELGTRLRARRLDASHRQLHAHLGAAHRRTHRLSPLGGRLRRPGRGRHQGPGRHCTIDRHQSRDPARKTHHRGVRGAREQQRRGLSALPRRPAPSAPAAHARTTTAPSSCTNRRLPPIRTSRWPISAWCTRT